MKTVVITGASSGLGKAAAMALAAQGWHVIAHGRDPERSRAAEAEIRGVATGRVDMIRADLSLLSDTARMADAIVGLTDHVDVILANAGGMRTEMVITPEGNDASFAGNHLGHFLLVKRLMQLLQASGAPRVISTTSDGHFYAKAIDWDDLQATREWVSGTSYCLAKLCNVLFIRALTTRGMTAHALHPGTIDSNFTAHCVQSTRDYMATLEAMPIDVAAGPLVWLAMSDEAGATSGLYWNRRVSEPPSEIAQDDAVAERLWVESEKLLAKAGF